MFSSWSLQSPVLLFALLSLLVPLAIHFFSKSKGKLVAIGNIKLIQSNKPVRMREIRLVDRFLLLCRLLILFISVLLLANLFFAGQLGQPKNTVLITTDWLNEATTQEKQQLTENELDSNFFLLSKYISQTPLSANKRLSKQEIIEWQADSLEPFGGVLNSASDSSFTSIEQDKSNTWALIANVDNSLPKESSLSVYSTNRTLEFSGNKVHFSRAVNWQIKELHNNKLTWYEEIAKNELSVAIISDDDRKKDLKYIKSALDILKSEKLPNLDINYFDSIAAYQRFTKNTPAQWIIYLSSINLPKSILAQVEGGAQLLLDAAKSEAITLRNTGWQVPAMQHNLNTINGFIYGKSVLDENITGINEAKSKTLWEAITSNRSLKILLEYQQGLGRIVSFHSRFNPQWNDLVIQPQFPHFILSVLHSEKIKSVALKQGRLTRQQVNTDVVSVQNNNYLLTNMDKSVGNSQQLSQDENNQLTESWLNKVLIVLLILLYTVERILSEKKVATKASFRSIPPHSKSVEPSINESEIAEPILTKQNTGQL